MKDDRIQKDWLVHISPFRILQTPVTQGLFVSVTGSSPSTHVGENLPVETVSWLDAVEFCNALSLSHGLGPAYEIDKASFSARPIEMQKGFRLPKEAEWEFACRAGTQGPRYGALDDVAWYAKNANNQAQPVEQKAPNAWGVYDMLGNVWEWCDDLYDEVDYGCYRVFRGGGWADQERGVLATNRRRSHPTFSVDDLGFRVAQSV